MRMPQFLKFEFDDSGFRLYPTAVAWSLADGRIKHVVLMPDEDWVGDDPDERLLDEQAVREQGQPPLDVIREMNEDLEAVTVYTDGLDPDDELIETLFETLQQSPTFECAPFSRLLKHLDPETLIERYNDRLFDEGLEPGNAESGVLTLLLLARDEGLISTGDEVAASPDIDPMDDE